MNTSTQHTIEFFFDFSSPYAYFAAEKINALASSYGLPVHWKPFQLGGILKLTGAGLLTEAHEWKSSYSREDIVRTAELNGLAFKFPPVFPQGSAAVGRTTLWIEKTQGAATAQQFALLMFRELFNNDGNLSDVPTLQRVGQTVGIDPTELAANIQNPEARQMLVDNTKEAEAKKVFGAPTFVFDGERFWGVDRLDQLEARIKQKLGGKGYKTLIEQANAKVETLTVAQAQALYGQSDVVFVDLRDPRELEREGIVPNAFHAPRGMVEFWVDPKSPYYKPAFDPAKKFVFFCAAGWRSALTAAAVKDMGVLPRIAHMDGGFAEWKKSGAPVGEKAARA
jgi:2-hydroxychromene-2-carboxylate isomerase/rhodanese-related sulfurtransferase